MKCIGFERLIDYLDGRGSAEERACVMDHIGAGCPRCQADSQWYQELKRIGSGDKTVEPPPWVLKRAARVFQAQQTPHSRLGGLAQAAARLVYDSFKQQAPAGARSAAVESTRELVYAVDEYYIDLQISGAGTGRARVIGQLLNAADAGFGLVSGVPVNLLSNTVRVVSTTTNEIGEFSMAAVDHGQYELCIDAWDLTINIVGLDLTPER